MSINRKIAKASIILIFANITSHLFSLYKEILVASKFGIMKEMDAFYAAITIPNLINNILIITFGSIFIPIFVKYKIKDFKEANKLTSVVTNYIFIFLILISIALYIAAPLIIKLTFSGFNPEIIENAVSIFKLICFTILFTGLTGVFTGILNANEHFAVPAFTQLFIPLCTIIFLFLFSKNAGVYTLIYGLLAGLILQLIFIIPALKRNGYQHQFILFIKHPAVKEMISFASIYLLVSIASNLNILIDRIMASYSSAGSLAGLGYVDKLVQVPILIFTGSISTAVFPYFSSQAAESKIEEMKISLAKTIKMLAFIFLPITVVLITLSRPIIQIIFQRGAFDLNAVNMTASILIYYSFQLFFISTTVILVKVFLALQDTLIILKMTIAALILKVILNYVFMKIINPPVAGIALAASVLYFIWAVSLFLMLKKRLAALHGINILKSVVKTALISIGSGLVIYFVFNKTLIMFPLQAILYLGLRVIISLTASLVFFLIVSYFLKVEELHYVINNVKNKLNKYKAQKI